jgi:plastocyanin
MLLAGLLTACTAAAGQTAPFSGSSRIPTTGLAVTSNGVEVTIDLTARNLAFDKDLITVPAGAQVTVNFNNTDVDTYHNFSVYTDEGSAILVFRGEVILGPSKIKYEFTAPAVAGAYYFRSDVHPAVMTGTLEVK